MPTSEKIKERVEAREKRLKAENLEKENVDKNNEKKDETIGKKKPREDQSGAYRDPLKKIFGGRVMQYPIDLNTDLQDYFEIQIFKYRPAKSLPDITKSNQVGGGTGGYSSKSTQRGNRQNFRLQDLQATIQLPMPPSIKDMNQVDWGSGTMSGLASSVMGPAIAALMGQGEKRTELENAIKNKEFKGMKAFAAQLMAFTSGTGNAISEGFKGFFSGIQQEDFRRYQFVNAISQAVSGLGVNIEVDQAITRVSGAIRNPNLELLFKTLY